jgi:hypothetical protein
MTFRFNAQLPPFDSMVELRMIHKDDNGKRSVAQPIQMVEQDHTVRIVEPFLRLELSEAQELMDCLWTAGLRPTEGRGSAGALAATERHLSDMQKMAFQLLNRGG